MLFPAPPLACRFVCEKATFGALAIFLGDVRVAIV